MTGKPSWKAITLLTIAIALATTAVIGYHRHRAALTSHHTTPVVIPKPSADTPFRHLTAWFKKQPPWQNVVIARGDSLARLFSRLKIDPSDLPRVLKAHKTLTLLHPGDAIYFQVNSTHQLQGLKYPLNAIDTLILKRDKNRFSSHIEHKTLTSTLAFKSGVIHRSFTRAARNAGLTASMRHQFETIFAGTINFSRNIHTGDRFAFLYKTLFADGKKVRNGDIVAAEFISQSKTYHAIRYTYPIAHTSYYTPTGRGVEPRFLHTAVKYKRISSHFNRHRMDPIVHRIQPHLGIDYAARSGTPIKSIGDGKVIFIGRDGGYGNAIRIRYDRHDVALYGHMWHFAKNLKRHQYVHKGQIIGYVGETGWATGPHLHFGFYVNGVAKNWLAMKVPTEQSIPRSYHARFLNASKRLLAELSLHQGTELAENNDHHDSALK